MLNVVQALIFSVLTLMFTLLAIESHEMRRASWRTRASKPTIESQAEPAAAPAH